MGRPKKDARALNLYIRRDIYDRFAKFCEAEGYSKTVAAERALSRYMDDISSRHDDAVRKDEIDYER